MSKFENNYQIEETIGKGGMATVYNVIDIDSGKQMALKKMLPEYTDSDKYIERFRREYYVLKEFNHPGIVKVYDLYDDEFFFTMQLLSEDGRNLSNIIRGNRNGLPHEDYLKYAKEICDSIRCVHSKGIIHRDIKPSNFLVHRRHNQIKLVLSDFGIASVRNSKMNIPLKEELTNYQDFMGTKSYSSPEQILDTLNTDFRADIYSFGIILLEMITGKQMPKEIFNNINQDKLNQYIEDSLSDLNLHKNIYRVIELCTYLNREKRISDISYIQNLLNEIDTVNLNKKPKAEVTETPLNISTTESNMTLKLIPDNSESYERSYKISISDRQDIFFGRGKEADIVIANDPEMSRIHFSIFALERKFYIADLDSTNGVYLNNNKIPVKKYIHIKHGDFIAAGNSKFIVEK